MSVWIGIPFAVVLLLALLVRWGWAGRPLRRWLERRSARRAEMGVTRCAKCGYPLEGLELPRCPECGALRGFKTPLNELGLTEEEIREGFARRRRERESRHGNSENAS
jgi:hypothetical protein